MTNEEILRRSALMTFIGEEADKMKEQEAEELREQMSHSYKGVADSAFQHGWNRAMLAVLTFMNQQN